MSTIIDLFLQLVQIDSPTDEEGEVCSFIQIFLRERGIESSVDTQGNLLAKTSGIGTPLFLSAHMDTVEPGRDIKPHITDDGYIVSDGTTILGGDNKIGVAVLLSLVDELNQIPHRPLELLFTASEESGIPGSEKFDYSQVESKEGYCFDLTEPLGIIVTAAPYAERFEIEIQGLTAHAGRPHLGKNVLPALSWLLSQFRFGKLENDTYVNIGLIDAGTAINSVPGNAKLIGEIRAYTQDALESAITRCQEICSQTQESFGLEVHMNFILENYGYKHTNSLAQQFIQKTKEVTESIGLTPMQKDVMGMSDANQFNGHGLLVLELSTGGENAHTVNERITVKNLEKLLELAKELIKPGKEVQI